MKEAKEGGKGGWQCQKEGKKKEKERRWEKKGSKPDALASPAPLSQLRDVLRATRTAKKTGTGDQTGKKGVCQIRGIHRRSSLPPAKFRLGS